MPLTSSDAERHQRARYAPQRRLVHPTSCKHYKLWPRLHVRQNPARDSRRRDHRPRLAVQPLAAQDLPAESPRRCCRGSRAPPPHEVVSATRRRPWPQSTSTQPQSAIPSEDLPRTHHGTHQAAAPASEERHTRSSSRAPACETAHSMCPSSNLMENPHCRECSCHALQDTVEIIQNLFTGGLCDGRHQFSP